MSSPRYYLPFILVSILGAMIMSCQKQEGGFKALSANHTGIHFANVLDSTKNFRVLYYFYYYNGGGVATGDINNDGLVDIYFTANSRGGNRLYLNKGHMQFEDITTSAKVQGVSDWSSGATMVDINGDGYLDIYVCSVNNVLDLEGNNALYLNNKNNTFTESSAALGLNLSTFATQAAFLDFDLDGDLDCYLLNQSQKPNENLRDTSFRREYSPWAGDRLLRNDLTSTGKFTDVSKEAGIYQSNLGYGLGISIADLNLDGYEDIYIGNDFHENDYCYINNGDGTFSEQGAAMFNHYSRFSMGNDIADFDNDGHPDIFTSDMLPPDEAHLKTYSSGEGPDIYKLIITQNGYQHQYTRNCLHRNNGFARSFSDQGLLFDIHATDWSWSPLLADFDNDGFKDLFISAGIPKRTVDMDYINFLNNIKITPGEDPREQYNKALKRIPDGASHNYMYKGKGSAGFEEVSEKWNFREQGYFTGAAHADLDGDGDLDLAVNPVNATAFIYENRTPTANHLTVVLKGNKPNNFGIGAKVWCYTKHARQYQEFSPVKGFQSSSFHELHFGLDSFRIVDSVIVIWPDKTYQVVKDISNHKIQINQQEAKPIEDYHAYIDRLYPEPKTTLQPHPLSLNWKHGDNHHNDFLVQYLLPHQLSTRGPKIAVADVNGDDLDDFYVCGASGQPGSLWVQNKQGGFSASNSEIFSEKNMAEESDAIFFNANQDSFPDLLVIKGGHVYPEGDDRLRDHLYLNDGRGKWVKAANAIPDIRLNKTCVAAGDLDRDGDEDLFLGTYSQPGYFGQSQSSILLLNDGLGHFTRAGDKMMDLKNTGFVTAAEMIDFDGDQNTELLVAGEWMPLMIYTKKGDGYEAKKLNGNGLWQCLYVTDVNDDGYLDILAGNWGDNSKVKASVDRPLGLYINDFDDNGQLDPIVTYRKEDGEFSFLGKDELERVLPFLKKKYLYYSSFAGQPVEAVFNLKKEGTHTYMVDETSSSVFTNDGKGNFARQDLPGSCQWSPVFSFLKMDHENQYLSGGNFFGVRPYEGRYDAAALQLFSLRESKDEDRADKDNILSIAGEVRDMAWIRSGDHRVVLIARHGGRIEFFDYIRKGVE